MAIPILGDIIGGVLKEAGSIVSEAVVDKDKRDEVNLKLQQLGDRANERAHEEMLAQTEVNKVEAGHRSIFVAGWRPAMGWIGAFGLFTIFVIQPIVNIIHGQPAGIDTSQLMVLVGGMLGFGVQRSFDKLKGTSNDVLPMFPKAETAPTPIATPEAPRKKKGLDLWPF